MTFKRHSEADRRMASARIIVKMFLDATNLYPSHRKEFIRLALWKVTEAEGGKYRTRYRSRASLQAGAQLQHEHVYERAKMADELIEHPERMHEILDMAIGCVVTREEHDRLSVVSKANPDLNGWERYKHAGIVVVDSADGKVIELNESFVPQSP